MGAQDIINVFNFNNIDRAEFTKLVVAKILDKLKVEYELPVITDKLLYALEKKGKIPEITDEILDIVFTSGTFNVGIDLAITFLFNFYDVANLIDEWINSFDDDEEEPIPLPPGPDPIPQPDKKIKMFVPFSEPVRLWDDADNAPVCQSEDGWTYTATGDGFDPSGRKRGTLLWKLPPGKNPMVKSNWVYMQGTEGKCYGICCIGNVLYLLQSDKGSGWEGMQNCRIWNVNTNSRSQLTMQHLRSNGANWFFIIKGPGQKYSYQDKYIVDVGCVTHAGYGHGAHHANFKTPIMLWRGDIRDIRSFKQLGIAQGINGPRNNWCTTCSITYIPESNQYASWTGDWTGSFITQFISQADNVRGPFVNRGMDDFSPPMEHISYKDGTRWTGVFTCGCFPFKGGWFRMLSGHSPIPPSEGKTKDDSVWCQEMKKVYISSV